jgi:uncharacterized protein YggU (UPF0235/DUF167 family)
MSFWRAGEEGVTVMVKVRPRSRRPGVGGVKDSAEGPRLKIDVAEPAEDGKANQAVCAMLARALHRPRSSVRIVAGASISEKLLAVAGDSASLVELLRTL